MPGKHSTNWPTSPVFWGGGRDSHTPHWPQTCYVAKDDLELLILLPLPSKCEDYRMHHHAHFKWVLLSQKLPQVGSILNQNLWGLGVLCYPTAQDQIVFSNSHLPPQVAFQLQIVRDSVKREWVSKDGIKDWGWRSEMEHLNSIHKGLALIHYDWKLGHRPMKIQGECHHQCTKEASEKDNAPWSWISRLWDWDKILNHIVCFAIQAQQTNAATEGWRLQDHGKTQGLRLCRGIGNRDGV